MSGYYPDTIQIYKYLDILFLFSLTMLLSLLFDALPAILEATRYNQHPDILKKLLFLYYWDTRYPDTIRIHKYLDISSLFSLTMPLSLLFDALSAILAASGGVRWSYQPSINTKIAIDPISMACPVIQETWDE